MTDHDPVAGEEITFRDRRTQFGKVVKRVRSVRTGARGARYVWYETLGKHGGLKVVRFKTWIEWRNLQ